MQQATPVSKIRLTSDNTYFENARILGDAWERGYADLEWKAADETRIMPWYFFATDGDTICGFGVKTQPNALCFWTTSDKEIRT